MERAERHDCINAFAKIDSDKVTVDHVLLLRFI